MEFELPGQLRGPECRPIMKVAIEIRKKLNPWFKAILSEKASKLTVILRIDGSLGSYGPEGVENIQNNNKNIECDLVISDMAWATQSSDQISEILRSRIYEAIIACLDAYRIQFNDEELVQIMKAGT